MVDTSNVTFDSHGGILLNDVPQRSGLGGYDPNYKMTQVEAWTLSLQQQLKNDLIAEINYSGTEAHHLPIYQNANRFAGDLIVNKGSRNSSIRASALLSTERPMETPLVMLSPPLFRAVCRTGWRCAESTP